eukprot:TRINITY_DN9147_c0_g1_i5.p1 TRINITY_DN9147_c0_g1~~TRINITY_DN9147_c0_g1_i5.p1  ORF type:complete len:698 (+),score=208.67 TRINITY_DN9147_c0_g1_i5:111-2204(+)
MIRRPPRSTLSSSSAASDVYKRQRQMPTNSTAAGRGARNTECVKVVVRCRPMNGQEKRDERMCCAEIHPEDASVSLSNPKCDENEPPKSFTFDGAYGPDSKQSDVYAETGFPIVESVLEGYNGTIFAYGQTGTGKSHTMQGPQPIESQPRDQHGIIPNSFYHIFDTVSSTVGKDFLVRASYLEIYNEEIRDLLGKDPKAKLDLKQHPDKGVFVKDLTNIVVKSVAEIDHVMMVGHKNRSVGATMMNHESSRSHSIFTITVETCQMGVDKKPHIRAGKLNLVDLAGSERQTKTQSSGDRLKEATKINLSLSALGNCISALVDGKSSHTPFRDSKLTRLLEDSLGGNTKTCMIATLGPADYNYDETLSTLRYANRAKNIKNKPKINEDPKDTMMREMQEQIERLRAQIERKAKGGGAPVPASERRARGEKQTVVQTEKIQKVVTKTKEVIVDGVDAEEMKAIVAEMDEEKKKLMLEAARAEASARAAKDAEQAELDALQAEEQEAAQMQAQLQALEAKILHNDTLPDQTNAMKLDLQRKQAEMAERKRRESRLAQELAEQEEENMMIDGQFGSLQQAVEVKTKRLEKLFSKYQGVKTEINDIQEEYSWEREDMLDTIRELTKMLKLRHSVIEAFVPPKDVAAIECRAKWDQDDEEWYLTTRSKEEGLSLRSKRPQSATGARRHVSDYARMNAVRRIASW